MSGPSAVKETPIESRSQLVEYIASGARTVEKWKIGTEHEKFGFRLDDLRPPTYEGPRGIGALLNGMTRFGWAPVEEHGNVIALTLGDELQLGFLGMGFQPKWKREEMPWMPKGRYAIMRRYMPLKGQLGLDMMTRTCTCLLYTSPSPRDS